MKTCKKCGNKELYDGELCICCVYQVANPTKKPTCNVEDCKNCKGNNTIKESNFNISIYAQKDGSIGLMLEDSVGHRFYFTHEANKNVVDILLSKGDDYITNGKTKLNIKGTR